MLTQLPSVLFDKKSVELMLTQYSYVVPSIYNLVKII